MNQILVNQYLNDLDRYKKYSGSLTEGVISEAFKDLLKAWARQENLHFINQYEFVSSQKTRIRPDGTILHDLRVPVGCWEAKDTNDDLDAEIAKKLAKGYPQDNIIFEDSQTAVLIQDRREICRCKMTDTAALLKLLDPLLRLSTRGNIRVSQSGRAVQGGYSLCSGSVARKLVDEHVEILDPATGTGTFICELLEHFRGQPQKLAHKYKNELHANEVAILPYYVANLNVEATYAAITGQFAEYPNLCFVDTLDNVSGLGIKAGYQHDMFAGMSEENVERVKRRNKRKISVIIGNPPYNANQANENDNNKNREYKRIDELIKSSYIRLSTAQKAKVYDMYARFFRWASDRMADDGVLAFITNRSFIDSRTFDGFRRAVAEEFNEIYVVDLGGDVRANPKLSGTKNNVFGIQTGVAISFFVKRHRQKGCKIFCARRPEFDTADDKLSFLASTKASAISFQRIEPDKNSNWVNLTDNDWDELIPVADKKTKVAKAQEKSIFQLYRLGNRSGLDWILDQYKEKAPKDPTIREKFNTYRFADYKEKVIDLLGRVTGFP
jgi:predicted helicase